MALYDPTMDTRITIDRAGRVVIPKLLRDRLRLEPGDTLEIDADSAGDQITLRPVRADAPLLKEQGIWVYRTGVPLTNLSILQEIDRARTERIEDLQRSENGQE